MSSDSAPLKAGSETESVHRDQESTIGAFTRQRPQMQIQTGVADGEDKSPSDRLVPNTPLKHVRISPTPEDNDDTASAEPAADPDGMAQRSSWREQRIAMQPMITGPGRAGLGPVMSGTDFAADRDLANEEEHRNMLEAAARLIRDRRLFRIRTIFLVLLMALGCYLIFICPIPEIPLGLLCWSVSLLVITTAPGFFCHLPKAKAVSDQVDRDDVAVILPIGGGAACFAAIPVLLEGLERTSRLVPMEHIWLVMNGKQEDVAHMGALKHEIKAVVANVNVVFVPRPSKMFALYWLSRHLRIGRSRGLNNYKSVIVMDHDTSLTPEFHIPQYEAGHYVGYSPEVKAFACLLRVLPPAEDAPCNHKLLANLQDLEYMGGSLNKVLQHYTSSVICPNGAFFMCHLDEFVDSCAEHDDVFHGDDVYLGYVLTERLGHDMKILLHGAALTEPPYTMFFRDGRKGLLRQRGYSWDLVNFKLAKLRLRMAFGPSGRRGFCRSITRRLDALQELNSLMIDPFRIALYFWCFWKGPYLTLYVTIGFIVLKWMISIITFAKFKDGFPKRLCLATFLCIPLYQLFLQAMRLYGMFVYFTNFKAVNGNWGRRHTPIKHKAGLPDPQHYEEHCPRTLNSQDLIAHEIDWFTGEWGKVKESERQINQESPPTPTQGSKSLTGSKKGGFARSLDSMANFFRRPAARSGSRSTPSQSLSKSPAPSQSLFRSGSNLSDNGTWDASLPGCELSHTVGASTAGPNQVLIEFASSRIQSGSIPPIDLCRQHWRSLSSSGDGMPATTGVGCSDPNCRFCVELTAGSSAWAAITRTKWEASSTEV